MAGVVASCHGQWLQWWWEKMSKKESKRERQSTAEERAATGNPISLPAGTRKFNISAENHIVIRISRHARETCSNAC